MTVDGPQNTVYECDSVALPPGPENPYGNAWVVRQTPLRRESEAQRVADGRAARYWKIANPGRPNATGEPVAYKLMPQDSVLPFGQPGTRAMQRAQFAARHLWVTAYDPDQRFPAGEYPNQHPGGDGLPAWTAADRPLENTDLVLWHTFTAHHVVRPEDWPVMPVTRVGFQLRADGFFDGNPALDVPPAPALPPRELRPAPGVTWPGEHRGPARHDGAVRRRRDHARAQEPRILGVLVPQSPA